MKKTTLTTLFTGAFFALTLQITQAQQLNRNKQNKPNSKASQAFYKGSQLNKTNRTAIPKILQRINEGKDQTKFITTSQHVSSISGIKHKYIRQAVNGLEVIGTESSLHNDINGRLIKVNTNWVQNIEELVTKHTSAITPEQAISSTAIKMGYGNTNQLHKTKKEKAAYVSETAYQKKTTYYTKAGISSDLIPLKKLYYYNGKDKVVIAYEFAIKDINSSDWYNFIVDANSGNILHKYNLMHSCNIAGEHTEHNHNKHEKKTHKGEMVLNPQPLKTNKNTSALVGGGSYNVYPMPIESPGHGNRSIVTDPADADASPFGWHDVNGVAGAEYTYTRGNNTEAYDDDNGSNGASNQADYAEGGAGLAFNFPLNTTYSGANQSEDAAVTNTFFWANIIHDVVYKYGFDEAAGNFQENNYGNGGAGGDSVNSEIQDGSGTCNANFGTPPEGNNPRMQMFVCGGRDGDFDNVVIAHEYTHGISTRLTGGAANSGCLQGQEQMGEGWGDFLGLMMTIEPGDQGTDQRGIGTWLVGQGPNGAGIRPQPYSTTNTQVYADIATAAIPHGVGSVWSSILWKLNWALIDVHGFDADIYNGTGGNNICLALVMEGMKLQGCNPGFIDGRDAILAADAAMNGGANTDTIWEVFAGAGLGVNANQGTSGSNTDGTSDNTVPPPATPTVTFTNETSTVIEGSNCDFTDITIPVNIGVGASQSATANFTVNAGSSANTTDYQLINTTVTFNQGATASQNLVVRVFNDSFVEGNETIEINFTVNNNGGDAGTGNNSHIITITDDDIATTPSQNVNLYSENFDPISTNIQSEDIDGDGNDWNLSDEITLNENPNTVGFDGQFAVSRSWIPDGGANGTTLTPNNLMFNGDAISIPANATSATLSFVAGTVQPAPFDKESYAVYVSNSNVPANIIATTALYNETLDYPTGGFTTRTINLSAYIGQDIYFGFRHFNTVDMNTLIIDNISVDIVRDTPIQTAINEDLTNATTNLPSAGTIYTNDASTGFAMLDITNTNGFNYGCLDISVNRSGNSSQSYNGSTGNNLVMDKTFKISTTNSTDTNDTDVSFYVTQQELNAITAATGLNNNQLFAHREGSNDIIALSATAFGTDFKLTGTFTGLNGTYYIGAEGAFKTRLAPKVFLSGPAMSGGLMDDALRVANYLPKTSPYSDNLTVNPIVFNVTGANAIVDWVWVELRDATDNTVVSASKSALLQRDGDVVDLDGTSALTIVTPSKSFYVVINHRNHLATMTNATIALSATPVTVDFTNGMTTFGTNAQKDMGSGTFGLWAGDANGDGKINYLGAASDALNVRSTVFNDPNNTVFGGPPVANYGSLGYTNSDINLTGQTYYIGALSDVLSLRSNILSHPSNSIFGGPPTATYIFTEQLP